MQFIGLGIVFGVSIYFFLQAYRQRQNGSQQDILLGEFLGVVLLIAFILISPALSN